MNGTILIVDDDDDTAVLLRDSLRKRGFDVDAVNSAQQCLEHLRTEPADVVVAVDEGGAAAAPPVVPPAVVTPAACFDPKMADTMLPKMLIVASCLSLLFPSTCGAAS